MTGDMAAAVYIRGHRRNTRPHWGRVFRRKQRGLTDRNGSLGAAIVKCCFRKKLFGILAKLGQVRIRSTIPHIMTVK